MKTIKKSKKNKFIGLMLIWISIFTIGVIAQGCQDELLGIELANVNLNGGGQVASLASDEFMYFGKRIKCQNNELKWKKQFSLILQNNYRIKENDLVFENYRYIGKISSIEELEQIKMNIIVDAVFPIYSSADKFEIGKHTETVSYEGMKEILDKLIPISENTVVEQKEMSQIPFYVSFEMGDMATVEIEWIYKGDKLKTIAIVSDKYGIVYDNLLYFIHFKNELSEERDQVIPRLKSGSENSTENIQYNWCTGYSYNNLWGIEVYYYYIECKVRGTKDGQQKSITTYNLYSTFRSSPGYSCNAQIQSKSFSSGTNGHLTYAYGYCHGIGFSISLTWNGAGFDISGGGIGETGEKHVTPDDLD